MLKLTHRVAVNRGVNTGAKVTPPRKYRGVLIWSTCTCVRVGYVSVAVTLMKLKN